ncbi:MAG: class I SAM-dependent methyltransferase [Planctomycetaceae bacterium]|nr:class I SAM-dependent methyltransferase [Planctomycetaceae bacterium]
MNEAVLTNPSAVRNTFLDRTARSVLRRRLAGLSRGEVVIQEAEDEWRCGRPGDLQATVQVHRPRFYRQALVGGTLSVAESYLQGDWDCDNLTSLFRIFLRDRQASESLEEGPLTRLANFGRRLLHWGNANTVAGSRRNISAHYDVGNEFYRLWLDETMAYSSAIFPHPTATLAEGSIEKFDRICRKLALGPSDKVVEIGTGWGGFALHAAGAYGSRITTTTISREQRSIARERIEAAGLADRITLLDQDYRDLRGRFDKLVSIEMIEAVGHRYLDAFFGQCSRLLVPDGSMVLQAIVMPERGYPAYLRSVDFLQRYIFPGGCVPSLGAMLDSVARATDLRFVHAEDLAPHYAETLRRWRIAFHARINDVRQLGYSETFLRMWHYYLCYCEAAFEERYIGVLQVQFDKPECRRDPIELSRRAAGACTL